MRRKESMSNAVSANSGEKNEIIVYQPENGEFHIEATVLEDTIWLTQAQNAELFGTRRHAITKHLIHIFQDEELACFCMDPSLRSGWRLELTVG